MKVFWENDGEAKEGIFTATIDSEDGRGVQRFEGASHKEVADKLMQAQANATKKISELSEQARRELQPVQEKPILAPQPKPLTGDERVRLTSELQNPATAPEAVSKIVEAQTGRTLKEISEKMDAEELDEVRAQVRQAAGDFQAETPEYFFCDHNGQVMRNYFMLHRLDFRVKSNYHYAFHKLQEAKLLVMRETPAAPAAAAQEEPPAPAPERIAPATRPRGSSASSGLRAEHASGAAPGAPAKDSQKLTKRDIEEMSADVYSDRYRNEPAFRRIVDDLYAAPARAAR